MEFTQVKETCLYVSDLKKTRSFYNDLLGLPIISFVEGRHVFFRMGTSVLLCFNPDVTRFEQSLPPHYAGGKLHVAFEVDAEEYQATKAEIEAKGIPITHEETWDGGYTSFYFDDPDGNVLEIVPSGMWD